MSASDVVVAAGLRTPFCRRGGPFGHLTGLDLGARVVAELVERSEVDPEAIDQVVFGQVVPSVTVTNVAREIVLAAGLPRTVDAFSVSRACTTGYQAAVSAAQAIRAGVAEVVIAGGTDSASAAPITVRPALRQALVDAERAKGPGARIAAFADVRPSDLMPQAPAIAEPSTGETMGEAAERMAKVNGIPRAAQDEYAHRSHLLAAGAWDAGRFDAQVMPLHVPPAEGAAVELTVTRDDTVRADSDLARYAQLPPVFDREHGTVTAGNSSPLTDGAAALLMMRRDRAEALGYRPLGRIRGYAFAAVDPADQLLIGPVYSTPIALARAGVEWQDLDLVDMHEAFAAQMLSVLLGFESARFRREILGLDGVIGEIDWGRLNVDGGSIALGHPFAATGARQILQALWALRRRDAELALCTACAAGGLAASIVLEAL
jgi:acetyl-CoA acyltransferase